MQIAINGITINDYLDNYQCQIVEVFDEKNSFETIGGTKNRIYLGDKRVLSVNFEPMDTSQICELFEAIKSNREIEITYIDPRDGEATRIFNCDNLPAATYFESDYPEGILFWKIPTITFEQSEIESSGEGGEGGIYDYRLFIDAVHYPPDRISEDLTISNNISTNGFGVGQIATKTLSGKVLMNSNADIPKNRNAEIIVQKKYKTELIVGEWTTIGIFFIKDFTVNNNVLSFSACDSTAFLDNNYYVNYQRDTDGYIIPQKVSAHLNAIALMIQTITSHSEYSIPRLCDDVIIQPQDEENARTVVQKAAESAGINYREVLSEPINPMSDIDADISLQSFIIGQETVNLFDNQVSDFSFSKIGEEIETIILYCGSVTKLPTHIYDTMYKDYNIYVVGGTGASGYPIAANTLEVNAPYYPFSAETGGNFNQLLGVNFGTQFSATAMVDGLIPIGSRIIFIDQNLNDYYFYLTSARYKLTKSGIIADISGSARNISDFTYIAGMKRELENKFSLNSTYSNVYVDTDGISFAAPKE